ncbi:hypothetical protein GLYMA_05G073751v4 [Glycine max]|nr:hypothetical protein GLYMA_05G073751v4 [Glycine max]KAH1133229.1 hypothetical protein GYH30_011880 [Glycine max]
MLKASFLTCSLLLLRVVIPRSMNMSGLVGLRSLLST